MGPFRIVIEFYVFAYLLPRLYPAAGLLTLAKQLALQRVAGRLHDGVAAGVSLPRVRMYAPAPLDLLVEPL